ncbi:phosphotransferase family protein [Paenibacillus alkalitolerans]|uniref:phosphotransferase family protein n=1 Tax=Paenibacillus alkalitolerans TaxID=2799335 RepID=UPI0018F36248|nr:aminoglycoside phosphotransferase family protein [Paenibacillus alkalitolerans]
MESLSKYKLQENEMRAVVSHTFKQSYISAMELSDGWANMAYSILLDDGRSVVLKVAPPKDRLRMRCEKNNMRTEIEALTIAADSAEPLPVPRIYSYDPSFTLIPAEYFFMEHMQGTPLRKIKPSLSPEEKDGIERQLGIYNKRINSFKGTTFGYFNKEDGCKETWAEVFLAMIDDVLADGKEAGVSLPAPYSVIEKEIIRLSDSMHEVKEACLVHWDLWDGNVFIHEGEVSGIVDFERAFWGEPLIEYYFGRFANSAAFNDGYGRSIVTDSERRRRVLYDFYLDLLLVIECAFRQYENRNHIKWAYENFNEGFRRLQQAD